MPELPEVETVCRGLAAVLVGQELLQIEPRRAGLRVPFPPALAERLAGQRIRAVTRRAKFWQIQTETGLTLLGHLGMSGRMKITRAAETPPESLRAPTAQSD